MEFYKDYRKNYKESESHKNCKFCDKNNIKQISKDLKISNNFSISFSPITTVNIVGLKENEFNVNRTNQNKDNINNDFELINQNHKQNLITKNNLNLELTYERINEIFIESKNMMNNKDIDLILTDSITFSENAFCENPNYEINKNLNDIIDKSLNSKTIISASENFHNYQNRSDFKSNLLNSSKHQKSSSNYSNFNINNNNYYNAKTIDDFFDLKSNKELFLIESIRRHNLQNLNKIDNSFSLNTSNNYSTSVTWKKINEVKKVNYNNNKKTFLQKNNKLDLINYK
jgi:hypothetical protein